MTGTISPDEYSLIFRRYGLDGTLGRNNTENAEKEPPNDIGFMIEVIAPTQKLANAILSLARSTALHQSFDGRKATAGNLAFPFSPSDLQGGEVYEFSIYHLARVDDPKEIFPVKLIDVRGQSQN